MLLLIIVILGVSVFCFYKGYILAGIICLAGFLGKYGFLALIFTSGYLFYKGDFIVGILPIALVAWNIYGLWLMGRKGENKDWINLVRESYKCGSKGKYWKSIELAQKAIELNPNTAEAWSLIGNAYELLGDEMEESGDYEQGEEYHKNATEAWNRAKGINPNIIIPGYHE